MRFARLRLYLLVAASLVVASCGGGAGGGATTPPSSPPTTDAIAPSVPSNVAASAVSSTSATLTWSAATDNSGGSGLRGYRVLRDGVQIADNITATTYTDTTLSPSTRYSYTVRSVDNAGNVSADSVANAITSSPPLAGLDARPANATCLAPDEPVTSTGIGFERLFANAPRPVILGGLQRPGDASTWYIYEKFGLVYAFSTTGDGSDARVVADLQSRINEVAEGGLLGMAFDPHTRLTDSYISPTPQVPVRCRACWLEVRSAAMET